MQFETRERVVPSRDLGITFEESEPRAATITEAIYARIRTDILTGVLAPGMKLKLDALHERYEVSVNTLRETLSRLVSDGLVEAEGQRGFTVVAVSLSDLIDITQTRRLLECEAARISLQNADLEWESRLVAAYHKLSTIEERIESDSATYASALERYNREFHATLISGCRSRWLLHFHGLMYDQSLRYRMLAFRVKNFPRAQSRREHRDILDAALARDAEKLVAVLDAHITKGSELYSEEEASLKDRSADSTN
ncbi:MAG TPA: GntR family transcriptional regulator [Pseudorhodoplanes sp.]|jgi:DNA-binding GntR family transcriptional regulator|nr:GntR family transcriptional regulator [Pseudorhodoplanes sp.]